jgi:hypothetical protein
MMMMAVEVVIYDPMVYGTDENFVGLCVEEISQKSPSIGFITSISSNIWLAARAPTSSVSVLVATSSYSSS